MPHRVRRDGWPRRHERSRLPVRALKVRAVMIPWKLHVQRRAFSMITRISMKNFKAHASLELDGLPMISVLVGRNNSGKSSILHAAALPRYGPSFAAAVP